MFKKVRCMLPMNLQFFAGGDPGGDAGGAGGNPAGTNQDPPAGSGPPFQFDYEKLAGIVSGKQTVTEESVLKGYFKQQGLSKEQMDQAIAAYKEQQAAKQPDVAGMQTQLTQAQADVRKAQIESAATIEAVELGVDIKTIPYVLKMADLSQAVGQDGKISEETIKNALNKVLEDIPALKPQVTGTTGFVQVGAPNGNQQQGSSDAALKKAFGL